MVVSKLNLAILAAAVGGVMWIEHAHRITIEMPAPAERAGANTPACPENESVPFSADCMLYIQGGVGSEVRPRLNAADAALADSPERP
jgi:hypothetical protein